MRKFSKFIRNDSSNVSSTTTTIACSPVVQMGNNREKTPSSPQVEERKETNPLESSFKTSPNKISLSPLTPRSSDNSSVVGVKKVVSNRKQLFLSHVKQKKIRMDKKEESAKKSSVMATTCKTGMSTNRRADSIESLEQWTSFHSKQGLYSYFYIDDMDNGEDLRYGQFEMKEPPKIITRKTCA